MSKVRIPIRIAAAVACLAAATLAGGGVATASPGTTVTPKNASGCNGQVCITVVGDAKAYSVGGSESSVCPGCVGGFFGHFEFLLPNQHLSTYDRWHTPGESVTEWVTRVGGGQVCVRGWSKNSNGSYTEIGLPCEYVR